MFICGISYESAKLQPTPVKPLCDKKIGFSISKEKYFYAILGINH